MFDVWLKKLAVSVAGLGACVAMAGAQTHRVVKQGPVTRAVAVYEWTGELSKPAAARLVPVSLMIDGKFEDAGTYLARPIPLALLNENVYALEKSGVPAGTLTVSYARHLQPATSASDNLSDQISDLGWFGYGVFTAPAAEKPVKPLTATVVHGVTASKDSDSTKDTAVVRDRPSFSRKPADAKDTSSVTPVAPAGDDDPDRPHLSKNAPAASSPGTAPGDVDGGTPANKNDGAAKPERKTDTESPTSAADDADRPTLRHRDPKQAEADRKAREKARVEAMGTGPGDDPDRPQMRRGVATAAAGAPAQLSGLPPAMHQIVAVSDAETRAQHVFVREWESPAEKAAVEAKLTELAGTVVAGYGRGEPPAEAVAPRAGRNAHAVRKQVASPVAAVFAEHAVDGFQLEYGGLPTFVFQGQTAVRAPETAAVLVTIVAQRLPTGEMQMALSSVTDAAHLDRVPQYRLVDAVDADASNRASLLFELRGQTSRQFALYRLTGARADSIFVSNPSE